MNYFEKILFINLDRDTDKKNKFLSSIENSIIYPYIERFCAVNGRQLDTRIVSEEILSPVAIKDIISGTQKTFGISMTYGAMGCALSHYLMLRQCQISNKPYLVFEDDARIIDTFDIDLVNLIEHIQSHSIEFDIVYLGLHNIPGLDKSKSYDDMLYIPTGLTCGTWAMIISPMGASKILKYAFPLTVQIDSEISRNKKHLIVYGTKKELSTHCWSFGSSTQQQIGCRTDTTNNGQY